MSKLLPNPSDDEATRALIVQLGAAGLFDRSEAQAVLVAAGNSTDVDDLLIALEERQTIVRLGGEPATWELVID